MDTDSRMVLARGTGVGGWGRGQRQDKWGWQEALLWATGARGSVQMTLC